MGPPLRNFSLRRNIAADGTFTLSGSESDKTIYVEYVDELYNPNAAAITWLDVDPGDNRTSYIQIDKGTFPPGERDIAIALAHELMHALGIDRHVAVTFATILDDTGENPNHQTDYMGKTVFQPLSILYPVDREALRALYGRLNDGDLPTEFGAWSDTSTHLHANGTHAAFGIAWRNGYGEPWAHGYLPGSNLADNPALTGTAAWTGILLGFTPEAAPVAGTGTQWRDGHLAYTISVTGNTFRQTGGDEGFLTGAFFGQSHEGMGGTLERDDLTAAFGGSR